MDDFTPNTSYPPFKNRKTLLVVFGVIQLCFGVFCALLTVLMVVGMVGVFAMGEEAAQQGLQAGSLVIAAAMYCLLASWFISMGYGSLNARRWARSLTLAVAWIGIMCGVLGAANMLFFLGDMLTAMESQGAMPPGSGGFMAGIMIGFMLFFYVLLPGTLILVYNGKNAKATCELLNPSPSWTDACPLPVLIQTILLSGYSIGVLMMGAYNWATPFFGTILTGVPGAFAILSISICCAYLAWGCYRLRMKAWWGTVALILFWSISAFATFLQYDLMRFYSAMGMPEEQLEMMRPMVEGTGMQSVMSWGILVWVAGILAFFLYTKRYFEEINADTNAMLSD